MYPDVGELTIIRLILGPYLSLYVAQAIKPGEWRRLLWNKINDSSICYKEIQATSYDENTSVL